ncbi:MAG: ABC transporter ATP-binding protein [Gemmatimonadaceae bacterium]
MTSSTSLPSPNASASAPPLALDVRALRKTYADVIAVDGLDLQVRTGECFGLLGPNGAGKTTTIEICEGLNDADGGEVVVLGRSWARDEKELRQRLGIQLQETQFAEKLTVEETIRLFRSFYSRGRDVAEIIALVQLEEKRSARVSGLSGGQKQRLSVACALAGDPDLVFLDEPTTGLDPQSRRQLWELVERLRAAGRTIMLTTHYMDEAERLCDRIAIVDHGKVIALGTPRELIRSLGAEQVVECAVGEGESLDIDALTRLPGVIRARLDGFLYAMQVSAAHETIPALLAYISGQGAKLTELSTHSPTLEDVFVSLTGRHLREA